MKKAGKKIRLKKYDGKNIRLTDNTGMVFTGIADYCVPEFCMHEYGNEEAAVIIGDYLIYESQVVSVEELDKNED